MYREKLHVEFDVDFEVFDSSPSKSIHVSFFESDIRDILNRIVHIAHWNGTEWVIGRLDCCNIKAKILK